MTDPVILVCGAGIIIALATIIYVFVDDWLRHSAFRKNLANLENEIAAERAVRETETVHTREYVRNVDTANPRQKVVAQTVRYGKRPSERRSQLAGEDQI